MTPMFAAPQNFQSCMKSCFKPGQGNSNLSDVEKEELLARLSNLENKLEVVQTFAEVEINVLNNKIDNHNHFAFARTVYFDTENEEYVAIYD